MIENYHNQSVKSLSYQDFEEIFREKLSDYVVEKISKYAFRYTLFSPEENEQLLIKIVDTLLDQNILQSGEHRLDQWEQGWAENLDLILQNPGNIELIVPKYFNKYGAIRWRSQFIQPISDKFEFHSLAVILDWLFDKYLRDAKAIYEFGCGTGHNLLRAREVNAQASLYGLDWTVASQKIIARLAEYKIDQDIHGHQFDYFNPDADFHLAADSIIYTVASLEQVGTRWEKFLEYLMQNRPKLCIHVEPVAELLDPKNLIDYLSICYFKKRKYLSGFLIALRQLEAQRKVKIHLAQRTYIGSLFIEGYSVIVWSPL